MTRNSHNHRRVRRGYIANKYERDEPNHQKVYCNKAVMIRSEGKPRQQGRINVTDGRVPSPLESRYLLLLPAINSFLLSLHRNHHHHRPRPPIPHHTQYATSTTTAHSHRYYKCSCSSITIIPSLRSSTSVTTTLSITITITRPAMPLPPSPSVVRRHGPFSRSPRVPLPRLA